VVAEHSTEWGHQIKFKETEVLAKTAFYMDKLVKEPIKNMTTSREEGFKLSEAWNPAIKILQTNNMNNTNNTRCVRFRDGRENQWQANIGQRTEDHVDVDVDVDKQGGHQINPCTTTISWPFVLPSSSNPPVAPRLQQSTVLLSEIS
jgi:hypothetical protein